MSNKYKKSFKERLAIFIAAILDIIITGFLLMMFIIGEIDLTEIQFFKKMSGKSHYFSGGMKAN